VTPTSWWSGFSPDLARQMCAALRDGGDHGDATAHAVTDQHGWGSMALRASKAVHDHDWLLALNGDDGLGEGHFSARSLSWRSTYLAALEPSWSDEAGRGCADSTRISQPTRILVFYSFGTCLCIYRVGYQHDWPRNPAIMPLADLRIAHPKRCWALVYRAAEAVGLAR
jgi:hypothetical protein